MLARDDPLLGVALGRYTLVRRLARGGQSSIYEATSGGARVAIKVLHASGKRGHESAERLRREAIAIQRLDHPNVIRLLDYGELPDGNPWLAMEFLEGENLAELLERVGTLSEAEVIRILAPICEALAEAHAKNVIHRDLKPENIMLVTSNGVRTPKLLDFGIAALLGADPLTSSVTVSGTPMYMAPEQWEGLSRADARSDIYSLGVIVYRALSGKYAYSADTPLGWMKQIHSETPLDLEVAMAGRPVSPVLRAAVMKALARDPRERPQTPMELLRALQPAPVLGPSAERQGSRTWRLVLLTALVVGCLASAAIYFARRPEVVAAASRTGPPLVLLMDTPVSHGVYDADSVPRGGTNADTLNDLLRDLPISIEKETLPSTWNREKHVVELTPDLIVIHRSAFFHGLNLEFGFGYEPFPDELTRVRWGLLYRTADDKLLGFLGFIATTNQRTKFLIYSRGTGGTGTSGWQDAAFRTKWVAEAEQRFPALKGRITTLAIEGGVERGTFKSQNVARQVREALTSILGLAAP
jgi:serine/threonine-protein kinase